MDLLEYQAKALFYEMGIPVLPSQRIDQTKDLKGLKIPYPVVLKSQVRRGGRGRAGGIKFVENTIDAIAAAQAIFHLPIMGEYPEVLLAEAKYDADQEFYLAVALDSSVRRPVLLGSQQGGIGIESAFEQMQQVVVDQDFSPFYARRLALKMGLQGELIRSVSAVVEKMYQLFVQKDLDLVEINPLGIGSHGEVMALDGKVTINDSAFGRHPELSTLTAKISSNSRVPKMVAEPAASSLAALPPLVELEGNIAILCNGAGLTMATLDLVYQSGGKPANSLNIGGDFYHGWPPVSLPERLKRGLELVTQDKKAKVVLVNILSQTSAHDEVVQIITDHVERRPVTPRPPHFVVRLVSLEAPPQVESPSSGIAIHWTNDLDETVTKAVSLAR